MTTDEPSPASDPTVIGNVIRFGDDHYGLHTELLIDAPASKVWAVLTDWTEPLPWSSSFLGIVGEAKNGAQVTALYHDGEGGRFELPRNNLVFDDGVEFGWSEEPPPPFQGFVDRHRYRVEPVATDQTRFIQSDSFQVVGPNETYTSESLARALLDMYLRFNAELKSAVLST